MRQSAYRGSKNGSRKSGTERVARQAALECRNECSGQAGNRPCPCPYASAASYIAHSRRSGQRAKARSGFFETSRPPAQDGYSNSEASARKVGKPRAAPAPHFREQGDVLDSAHRLHLSKRHLAGHLSG